MGLKQRAEGRQREREKKEIEHKMTTETLEGKRYEGNRQKCGNENITHMPTNGTTDDKKSSSLTHRHGYLHSQKY